MHIAHSLRNSIKFVNFSAEVLENSAVYHPSIYDNQCRSFGGYSETQPLLGNDSNNYNYTTMKSLKARKLTRKTSVASESKRLEEKGDMSKAVNRQQVEQKKVQTNCFTT